MTNKIYTALGPNVFVEEIKKENDSNEAITMTDACAEVLLC